MVTPNAKFRYRNWDIYTQNGEFTVGGCDNCSFDDCSLENLGCGCEYKATRWLREKGYCVKFIDYGNSKYVPYETYLEHLMLYQLSDEEEDLRPDTLVAPEMHLSSIKEAKEFIDFICDEIDDYIFPELR